MELGIYREGDQIPLTAVFQNAVGGDTPVLNPIVEILTITSDGTVETVLPPTPMVKRSSNIEGDYFFLYTVPKLRTGAYFVNYRAEVDGVVTTGSDNFRVSSSDSGGTDPGVGLVKVVASVLGLNVTDHLDRPMADVDVTIYNSVDGTIVARRKTDSNGDFLVYLSTGEYLFKYQKMGWLSETLERVISI